MRRFAQYDKPQWRIARATPGVVLAAMLASCGFYPDWRGANKGVQIDSMNALPGDARWIGTDVR